MKRINMNRIRLMLGTSKPCAVFTLINLFAYGAWLIIYAVCTAIRSSLFTTAQTQMSLQGQTDYTVTVSSPVFGFLKIMLYLLPVISIAWAVIVMREDKRAILCDKKLLIVTLCVVIAAAFTAFIDIGKLGLIF